MNELKLLTAKDARALMIASNSFQANLFKEIKHAASTGHNTINWDVTDIDPVVIEQTEQTLSSLGYNVVVQKYDYDNWDDNTKYWIIKW